MKPEAMRQALFVGVAVAMLLTSATSWGQDAPMPADVAKGQEIVTRKCSQCHAVGVKGDSPNSTAPRFRQLHERYDIEALSEGLAEGLTVGHGPMPEWRFEPDDVGAIVAYMKSVQTPKATKAARAPR